MKRCANRCVRRALLLAMHARWSARRSAVAKRAADRSTPSASRWRFKPRHDLGGSSNGRTTDSDSVYLGSNPSPPAKPTSGSFQRLPEKAKTPLNAGFFLPVRFGGCQLKPVEAV